ncbi:hypothetical protein P5V15_000407 [Pogonomyrmex californicus]
METEEFCNVNISPLVTLPFATQWSPDNQISIITENGIHVLELQPSPMSPNPIFKFTRSFIYPPDTLSAFIDKIGSLEWNLQHEEIYSALMNDISSKLDGIPDKLPRIVKAAWSPKNLIFRKQCILAILNSTGAVELLHKVSNNWHSICDISSFRMKIVEDEIKTSLNEHNKRNKRFHAKSNNQYANIIENFRKLQACSITWSELYKKGDTSFAYFSVAYCYGDILIWKISRVSSFKTSLQPMLVGRINLNNPLKVNVLCWITINTNKYLIIVGYCNGEIYGINLIDRNNNNLQTVSVTKYVDSDNIAVNYMYIILQDKSNIKILVAKGPFLLLLCINPMKGLKSMRYLHMQSNITGIIPIIAQQFLITIRNNIFVIDIQSNDLVNIDVKNNLSQTNVQYLGLAHSPNKVIFVNITSPNTIYDHLVTREPSIMHVFGLRGAVYDPLSIINNSTNLGSIWDCMEMIRLKATKSNDLSAVLCPIPKKLESLSLCKLQIAMWMTVIMNVCTTKKPMPNMDHIRESKITQTLPLIFLHSACTYLENSMKKTTLSDDQTLAVTLLRRYLEMYQRNVDEDTNNTDNIIHQRVRATLNATAFYPNRIEKCTLCDEEIDEVWHVQPCPSGHKLSRCSTTLLQITLLEYRICPICRQIFHPCLENMYEEPECLFCDVPILHNLYNFDVQDTELYGKNLSQRQVVDMTESLRDVELDEPFHKIKQNKWNTSHTYSIIVSNADDESPSITEKWEEF